MAGSVAKALNQPISGHGAGVERTGRVQPAAAAI